MDFLVVSIPVILLKADKLSHFCSLEAESFLWRVLVAGLRGSVSEPSLDEFVFRKITGSEFPASFTNTILDVIPPHQVILQREPLCIWVFLCRELM